MSRLTQWPRRIRKAVLKRACRRLDTRRRSVLAWWAMAGTGVHELTFAQDGFVWTVSAEDDVIGASLFTDGGYQLPEIRGA